MKFQVFGATSPEESLREKEHKALSRRAAAEGIVLLKNSGVLPLKTRKIALYGPGSRMTVKGGSGSGDVHERHSVTIEEGLKNAGFQFPTTLWMDRFKSKYDADVAEWRSDLEEKVKKFNPVQTMQMFIFIGEHPIIDCFSMLLAANQQDLMPKSDSQNKVSRNIPSFFYYIGLIGGIQYKKQLFLLAFADFPQIGHNNAFS